MVSKIPKRERLIILLEAYFTFHSKATIPMIYDWLIVNKIHGYQDYTKADITSIMKRSIYFEKDNSRPYAWWNWKKNN